MAQNEYLATRLFRDRTSAEREYEALLARSGAKRSSSKQAPK